VAQSQLLVQPWPVPGGVAVVDFYTSHPNPKAFYHNALVFLQPITKNHWQALIGIPLSAKNGMHSLKVLTETEKTYPFRVSPYAYKTQHITLKGNKKQYINPNYAHQSRMAKEQPLLANIKRVFSDDILATGFFSRPVTGVVTSPFGLKRFFNNQPKRPHSGLDFAGKLNTTIKSPAKGSVILTGDFYFNGKTIFIDHGQGLISVYIHLNKILVKNHQVINKNTPIGTIGKTGRATGAHLHWGIYLNQAPVNPALFLGENNVR
jgi:murein DD-endopeptidase MepM/ murein hydrolase activator NlpD